MQHASNIAAVPRALPETVMYLPWLKLLSPHSLNGWGPTGTSGENGVACCYRTRELAVPHMDARGSKNKIETPEINLQASIAFE